MMRLCNTRPPLWSDLPPRGPIAQSRAMARERYLIVGLAKTGTTAVAMTVCNTMKVRQILTE